MLDGIITLSQPFFMMASTIYAVLASINSYWPFYYQYLKYDRARSNLDDHRRRAVPHSDYRLTANQSAP